MKEFEKLFAEALKETLGELKDELLNESGKDKSKKDCSKPHYHIVVTDNETGETHIDTQSNAIVASVDNVEDNTCQTLCLTACDTKTILATMISLQKLQDKILQKNPILRLMLSIHGVAKDEE